MTESLEYCERCNTKFYIDDRNTVYLCDDCWVYEELGTEFEITSYMNK